MSAHSDYTAHSRVDINCVAFPEGRFYAGYTAPSEVVIKIPTSVDTDELPRVVSIGRFEFRFVYEVLETSESEISLKRIREGATVDGQPL